MLTPQAAAQVDQSPHKGREHCGADGRGEDIRGDVMQSTLSWLRSDVSQERRAS